MTRMWWVLVLVIGLAAALPAKTVAALTLSPYVVVYKSAVTDASAETKTLQSEYTFIPGFVYTSGVLGFSAQLTPTQVSELQSDSAVAYAEPDTTLTATGLQALTSGETVPVGIRRTLSATTTQVHAASGVGVAVIDTGIDLSNADLNAVSGANCVSTGSAAQDDNGHGTNVAGIIAARDQGSGVIGVAPGTKLYAVKVLAKNGSGSLSQILCGINWVSANAAALNIKVANLSFAGSGSNDNNCGATNSDAEHQAICKLVAAGVTPVAAAGNSKTGFASSIPAAYPEALTVTAMSDTDGIPGAKGAKPSCVSGEADDTYGTYSNYGVSTTDQAHTIAAPGTCIVSDKLGGGTSTYYGSSQAAPHVAGAVALCINDGGISGPCAGLAPAQVISRIRTDAAANATSANGFAGDPFHPMSGKYFGYLVDAGIY